MARGINQDSINKAVWDTANVFRGVIDPAQYKDYILVPLFWRYMSDVWADHYATYKERFGDDEERIRRRLENERFVLPEGTSFHELNAARNAENLGERINIALEAIEEANKQKLKGILTHVDFNSSANLGDVREKNRRLKQLLEEFAKPALDFSPSRFGGDDDKVRDVVGEAYIATIAHFAADAGKKAGEFYTPRPVSELLVRLMRPRPGMTVCDPACGSGTLLLRAADEVAATALREGLPSSEARNVLLAGQEVNRSTAGLAKMNMFLHGQDSARIEVGNTITAPALLTEDALTRFDIVVANPPFSLKKWGLEEAEKDKHNRFHRGLPPGSKGDYAFVSHMIETAKPLTGRIGLIAPHGVLFRGAREGVIRRRIVEENLLDAVIGLPAQLFPTTGIPVCIMVLDRAREAGGARADMDTVTFIDASRDFEPGRKMNQIGEAQIERVLAAYASGEPEERYSAIVPRAEIAANGYNLNIPRYVDTFEPEPEVDLDAVQAEIDAVEAQLAEVRGRMAGYMRELGYGG